MTSETNSFSSRWYHRAGIWLGIGINPAAITLGGGLASRLPVEVLVWLMPMGILLLGFVTVGLSILGFRNRAPFGKLARTIFGVGLGGILLNILMALGMSGWNGFQLGLTGTGLSNLLGAPLWVGVLLMGAFAFSLSRLPLNSWSYVTWLATLSSVGLAVFSLVVVREWEVSAVTPSDTFTLPTVIWVIATILAYAALFTLRSADFAWDMHHQKDILIDGLLFTTILIIASFIGLMLYRATGDWNLAEIFAQTSLPWLGNLFLVLSLLSPLMSTVHSGSLAWEQILPISQRNGAFLLLGAGILLGVTRFDRQLLPFLDWIGTVSPAAVFVMLAVGFSRKQTPTAVALFAWIAGSIVGLALKLNGNLSFLAWSIGVAMGVLLIGRMIAKKD